MSHNQVYPVLSCSLPAPHFSFIPVAVMNTLQERLRGGRGLLMWLMIPGYGSSCGGVARVYKYHIHSRAENIIMLPACSDSVSPLGSRTPKQGMVLPTVD